MWLDIPSGDCSLNVSMWLTGGNVDIIFKLQNESNVKAPNHPSPSHIPQIKCTQVIQGCAISVIEQLFTLNESAG